MAGFGSLRSRLARARGLARSLYLYHWPPSQRAALDSFYRRLVAPGDLCFDIGAHVGGRSASWRRLGARVVAVEPQPDFARFLRWYFKGDGDVRLVEAAIDRTPGEIDLHLSYTHPTVSTTSREFLEDTREIPSFREVEWGRTVRVPAVTLDELIARFGEPAFVKIDVEGHELAVLEGLSRPLATLSFEFLAGTVERAKACLARLESLGAYRYNVSTGESLDFVHSEWRTCSALEAWLDEVAGQDFSGDVYARRAE